MVRLVNMFFINIFIKLWCIWMLMVGDVIGGLYELGFFIMFNYFKKRRDVMKI